MSQPLVAPELLTRPASLVNLLRWQLPSCDYATRPIRFSATETRDPYDALADMTQGTEQLAILLRRLPN